MNSLKAVASNLEKAGSADKDLITTIDTMKWIQETNSILFTGTEKSLEKIEDLVKKFDIEMDFIFVYFITFKMSFPTRYYFLFKNVSLVVVVSLSINE